MEIQTTVRDLAKQIKELNIPPDTPIKVIVPEQQKIAVNLHNQKGKWAGIVEEIRREKLLDKESGETLRKASEEFRANFLKESQTESL